MVKMLPDRTLYPSAAPTAGRATWILFSMSAILNLGANAASGQGSAGMGTWGFVNVRYDTRSPASIYTGYG